jgi:dTDP-4-dehydrorhamnose 3,5-epimerase
MTISEPNIPWLPITAKRIDKSSSAILRLAKQVKDQMSFTPLKIEGSWVFEPTKFDDERGSFHEVFKLSQLTDVIGRNFEVKQVNHSISKAGVIRGIHWADTPPGQAKYISCFRGKIWDVVVDIRLGSPSFGQWEAVELSAENGKSVLILEGLAHVFLSLQDDSVVSYLCSEPFSPNSEHGIHPLDPDLAVSFASHWDESAFVINSKDSKAPSLRQAQDMALLPEFKS